MITAYTDPVTSIERGLTTFTIGFVAGATGAVPATFISGKEFRATPIVRNGVGDYTVYLRQRPSAYSKADGHTVGALDATKGTYAKVIAQDVSGAGTVRFQFCRTDTGVAAEVAEGDTVYFTITVKK